MNKLCDLASLRESEPPNPRVFAIVPAAGRSRRMGCDKQLLDIGGRAMLISVVEPLAASHVGGVMVVTHTRIAEVLAPRLGALNVGVVLNDDESSEMVDSIRIGLGAWRQREKILPTDGFLICPGDHPGITTAEFDACVAAFRQAPTAIVVACRSGRRGHPIIFPATDVEFVESPACAKGLSSLPEAFAGRLVLVECSSVGVTKDIDTPADRGGGP